MLSTKAGDVELRVPEFREGPALDIAAVTTILAEAAGSIPQG